MKDIGTPTAATGFVKQRAAGWAIVIREPGTGQRRWISRDDLGQRFKTDKAAAKHLRRMLTAADRGEYVAPSKLTVAGFMPQWIDARRSQLRPATLHGYEKNINAHIIPALGAIPLQQLTPQRVAGFYSALLATGRRDGKGGLSPRTVLHIHVVLHRAMRDAVRWRHIPNNVVDLVDPPTAKAAEMHTWDVAALQKFLASVRDDRLSALWSLAATSGARRAELLGLRWRDLDLDAGRLSIRQTLNDVGHRLVVGEPKTARSKRTMSLDATTVDALRGHKARQNAEIMAFGRADWPDHDLVFVREDGAAIHPAWLSRAFTQRVTAAGVPLIRLHDLRHTAATLMLAAGIAPKVASERLGHSTIAVTLDLYTSVLPVLEQDAADRLGAIVFGRP